MPNKSGVSLNWGGFDKALGRCAQNLGNTKALMASIGEALVSGTIKRFAAEETPDGKKWEPSARAQTQGGLQSSSAGKTLTDTARLRASIDYAATPTKVMVGSNVAYARIHQMGGKTGKGHKVTMPARPYLGVSGEDMEEVKETVSEFIKNALMRG